MVSLSNYFPVLEDVCGCGCRYWCSVSQCLTSLSLVLEFGSEMEVCWNEGCAH